ncbi:peptidylprolyl isomerase [Winogradskyella sp. 3972H.M.0a.05]|uniref:peptidylprolyl isomerase n=1 Tax=Winogradskyella sp. 3972H.M.0a.05 TaxID=2950277 RepID=UPI00339AF28B
MAVLNKIRQRSLVLILVIAMALFAFVLADLFRNTDAFSGNSQDVVGTVNGTDIKRDQFALRVENFQRRLGPNSSSLQAVNSIWNQEVETAIMNGEFEELGLSVEQDQMRELLKTNFASYPEFQNEAGVFDENRLNEFIANLQEIKPNRAPLGNFQINYDEWVNNEQSIASRGLRTSYYNMVKAGVSATINEAEAEYESESKTVDLSFVYVPYTTINDSLVEVTKSDFTNFIKNNEDEYKVEESREIAFVEFNEIASEQDEQDIQAGILNALKTRVESTEQDGVVYTDTIVGMLEATDIADYINLNSDIKFVDNYVNKSQVPAAVSDSIFNLEVDEYYGPYKEGEFYKLTKVIESKQLPDSVKVRHILISHIGVQNPSPDVTRTVAEAEKLADSVLNVVKSDRSKFADLAKELSSDPGSKDKGGEYDFHPKGTMVKPFNDFEFENNVGDMDVVQTNFGFHVIEILDQKNKSRALKLATLAKKIEPSTATEDKVFNDVQKFELALQNGDFQELAKERELTVRPVTVKELEENIPGLGNQRQIVRWAFEDESKVGDYKRFSIPGKGFVVVQLVKENKEGLMNPESASPVILNKIRNEKKAKLIRDKITASTIEEVSKNQGQPKRTAAALNMKNPTLAGAGKEPLVVGAAFGLEEGETSKLIDGEKGVYLVQVTKANDYTKLDNYSAIVKRLTTARANGAQSKVLNALKDAADIEDNRATFY